MAAEYVSPALAVFALAWALRLESKQSSMNRAVEDHEEADDKVHLEMKDDLKEIKDGVKGVNGKLDAVLLKFVPQAVQGFSDGPR